MRATTPAAQLSAPHARLSGYQQRILDFVRNGSGNGVIRATAGAGKTTTLVAVAHSLPAATRACFLAFARDAAAQLTGRLPSTVPAMTVHKLARSTLADGLGSRGVTLEGVSPEKYPRLVRTRLNRWAKRTGLEPEVLAEAEEYLVALSQLVRLEAIDSVEDANVSELASRHGLVPPLRVDLPELHRLLRLILAKGLEAALVGRIDFTDMLWVPVATGMAPPRFDFVCVDEAQDYSSLALSFTMRLVDPALGGRLLFVGDPRQSIFGFAGADSEALDRIARRSRATVLPLSISYRCPRSHVDLARHLAPEIEAGPQAEEGRVYWIGERVLELWVRDGDLILCRANAPLLGTCLRLVRSGRSAHVLGRDLAGRLRDLLATAFPNGIERPRQQLDDLQAREASRLRRSTNNDDARLRAVLAERADLLDCVRMLAEWCKREGTAHLDALESKIGQVFEERPGAAVLSTVHRAKGMEADRVFILFPELMPARYARTAQMIRGEACVQFVALTRARKELVFVTSGRPFAARPERASTARQSLAAGGNGRGLDSATRRPGAGSWPDPEEVGQGAGEWAQALAHARRMAMSRR